VHEFEADDPATLALLCHENLDEDPAAEAAAIAALLIPEDSPNEQRYDQWLHARIEFAGFNRERNTKRFRYGEPSPVTCYKKRNNGPCDAGSTQVARPSSDAPDHENLSPLQRAHADGCGRALLRAASVAYEAAG